MRNGLKNWKKHLNLLKRDVTGCKLHVHETVEEIHEQVERVLNE